MKTIIAGSRTVTDYRVVEKAIRASGIYITSVCSGCALGPDRFGEQWARINNRKLYRFPAHWLQEGRQAGMLRNNRMAEQADALIAVWDGQSKGTAHMIKEATRRGLRVYVHLHPQPPKRASLFTI